MVTLGALGIHAFGGLIDNFIHLLILLLGFWEFWKPFENGCLGHMRQIPCCK